MKKITSGLVCITSCLIVLLLWSGSCNSTGADSQNPKNKTADQEWNIIGPGAGGGVFIPTVSPFDSNFVFSKGDMTGAFVTYDGGKSWKVFNLMTVVQDFEFDPADPDVVYASSRGYLYDEDRGSGLTLLYRSENRGRSWKVIYPEIEKIAPSKNFSPNPFCHRNWLKICPMHPLT